MGPEKEHNSKYSGPHAIGFFAKASKSSMLAVDKMFSAKA